MERDPFSELTAALETTPERRAELLLAAYDTLDEIVHGTGSVHSPEELISVIVHGDNGAEMQLWFERRRPRSVHIKIKDENFQTVNFVFDGTNGMLAGGDFGVNVDLMAVRIERTPRDVAMDSLPGEDDFLLTMNHIIEETVTQLRRGKAQGDVHDN